MSFFMYLKSCSEINSIKFEKINLIIVLKITIDNRFLAFFYLLILIINLKVMFLAKCFKFENYILNIVVSKYKNIEICN